MQNINVDWLLYIIKQHRDCSIQYNVTAYHVLKQTDYKVDLETLKWLIKKDYLTLKPDSVYEQTIQEVIDFMKQNDFQHDITMGDNSLQLEPYDVLLLLSFEHCDNVKPQLAEIVSKIKLLVLDIVGLMTSSTNINWQDFKKFQFEFYKDVIERLDKKIKDNNYEERYHVIKTRHEIIMSKFECLVMDLEQYKREVLNKINPFELKESKTLADTLENVKKTLCQHRK